MAEHKPYTLGDYFAILGRRWIYPAVFLPAGVLIAIYIAFTLTPTYRSAATLMLELSSIPKELIRTSVEAVANQEVELVRRRVMTTDNLETLAKEIDPYPNRPGLDSTRAKAMQISADTEVERVDPVTLQPLQMSNAFSIYYNNQNPEIAQAVTEKLAGLFLKSNRDERTSAASQTYQFLVGQAEEAGDNVRDLERKLAAFKAQFGDALPETQAYNQNALDRIRQELESLNRQIVMAREHKSQLEVQLTQISPMLFDPNGDWRKDLADLNQDLAKKLQRYSPDHPEVQRLRRRIETMRQEHVNDSKSNATPDNPEYITVQNQLDAAKSELAGLEQSAARAREQINTFERNLKRTPEIERQYSDLMRDYTMAQEQLRSIEASVAQAALGQQLETEQRGDKLTQIRAAYYPNRPYSPNRLGILLMGFVLGGGLGIGLAAIRDSSDPSIRSIRDLAEITDIKPLAAVPIMLNSADRRRRLMAWAGALVVAAIAVSIVTSVVIRAA
jgi:polysaccharide chain length determinant protein (PEP-CTERM system associated)